MIYENIKEACIRNEISVSELERILKFPRGSIYKWSDHEPGVLKMKKIADTLKCTIDDLLQE